MSVCARQTKDDGSSRTECGNTGTNKAWDAPADLYMNSGVMTTTVGWYYVDMRLERWRPYSTVHCFIPGSSAANWSADFSVDGGGNWGRSRAPGGLTWGPGMNPDGGGWGDNCTQC